MERILEDVFDLEFPLGTNAPIFTCHMDANCQIPADTQGDIYLKVLNTDGHPSRDPIVI